MILEQTVLIQASATKVERCFSDLELMHRWLNPLLKCVPVGSWSTEVGAECRFILQTPFWQPTLACVVEQRAPGLIVWRFSGFFRGCDRWECQPTPEGTNLLNRFEFDIPNPLIALGFQLLAAEWTKLDMQQQLQRLRNLAERI